MKSMTYVRAFVNSLLRSSERYSSLFQHSFRLPQFVPLFLNAKIDCERVVTLVTDTM